MLISLASAALVRSCSRCEARRCSFSARISSSALKGGQGALLVAKLAFQIAMAGFGSFDFGLRGLPQIGQIAGPVGKGLDLPAIVQGERPDLLSRRTGVLLLDGDFDRGNTHSVLGNERFDGANVLIEVGDLRFPNSLGHQPHWLPRFQRRFAHAIECIAIRPPRAFRPEHQSVKPTCVRSSCSRSVYSL